MNELPPAQADLQPASSAGPRDFARTQRRAERGPAGGPAGETARAGPIRDPHQGLIADEWPQMAAPMLLGVAGLAFGNGVFHPLAPMLTALAAAVLVLLARFLAQLERAGAVPKTFHLALLIGAIGLPMFLYGGAIGYWASVGAIPWLPCFGLLITVSLLAMMIESGRLVGLLTSQVAMWSGVACVMGTVSGFLTLGIGSAICMAAFMRQREIDALAQAKAEEMARVRTRAEEILADYEETGQGWFWETDRRTLLTYISRPVADTLGCKVEELLGRPFAELFSLADKADEGKRTLAFHFTARSSFSELPMRAAAFDEERLWSVTGRPTYDSFNNFQGFRGSGADLTEKRRTQEHASRLAHFDSLTGLANRFQMSQTLEKILNAPNEQNRACAVFLIDLDRFKQVNDTLGHPAGDALLKHVAQRLERAVGSMGRVGRLGGDEFQVLLPAKIAREQLGVLAGQIIASLSQPYSIEESRVMIGASVGIAIAPDDGVTSEALIRNADLALYAAKDGGRGRYHFYAADLHSDAEERRQLEEDLRDAITHGDLQLYYQPVVQTATEKITGFEALLRWNHHTHGFISPGKFVPIAEDAGLIVAIGEWALRTACRDIAAWPGNVRVAVNVSPLQFANVALPSMVTNALAHAGLEPDRLELEITESVFLNDDTDTETMFRALKGIGVRLALDDFGTGYSSLGYLKRAPFDKIKIDQSFVRGATEPGSRNGAIIASIVSLAEALGMETTAEGVETLDELDLVRMLGCSHVQGYIYERPLSALAASARLANGLIAIAQGPRSSRAARQSMLRKVHLDHDGHRYDAMIRNISLTGALIEGLWDVPPGTIFRIQLSDGHSATATCRWCSEDRMGVEFSQPLQLDDEGRLVAVSVKSTQPIYDPAAVQRQVG